MQKGEREVVRDHLYTFGFIFATSAHSISEEVTVFSPLWFPKEKYLCLLSLVIIFMHVIVSNKILDHIE